MYGKILVPVDGSDTALKGLNEAIKIATTLGSTICLVHIVNEFIFDYSYSPAAYAAGVIDGLRELTSIPKPDQVYRLVMSLVSGGHSEVPDAALADTGPLPRLIL